MFIIGMGAAAASVTMLQERVRLIADHVTGGIMGNKPFMTKYKAVRTTVDGKTFASKKEAKRYQELRLLEKAGKIDNLQTQVRYTLIPKDELGRAVEYICDFGYYEPQPTGMWQWVIEDVKGFRTAVYKLKRRLLFKEMGLLIRET